VIKSCCAAFYELPVVSLLLGDQLHPGGRDLTRKLAEATIIGRDTEVLDVACGRGESDRELVAHRGCRVVGIDYSSANVARSRELTKEAGLDDRARFIAGDAERLPFEDGSFDVVICECSLCTFPDPARALSEIKRVLRPGGRVGISDVVLNAPAPQSLQDVIGHVLCITGALSSEGYRRELKAAGFGTIRSRDVSYVLIEMIDRIQRRLERLDDLAALAEIGEEVGEVVGLSDAGPRLTAAREFVSSGGAGYGLFSARKPRVARPRKILSSGAIAEDH
jgi:ubiquinone/menaquinone biosynthesis C-methylase UbiE